MTDQDLELILAALTYSKPLGKLGEENWHRHEAALKAVIAEINLRMPKEAA